VIGFNYLLFYFYLDLGLSLEIATSSAVFGGVILIYFFEKFLPFKREWGGFDSHVKLDAHYYFFIHIVFGNLLVFLTKNSFTDMVTILKFNGHPEYFLQNFSEFNKLLIVILISDLGRYWLHRLSHEWKPFWKVHAIHHSVERLYFWNTGRFHLIDKMVVLIFESFLFLYLGATPVTIALYYIFYSANGFLQHANIDIRLGIFNKIISGPEQHRFHHSILPLEANNNYGNKVSIYDQLFGTYYLPNLDGPQRMGLQNKKFPMSFFGQMKAPFYKGD
jgi:sterol desaturase/sphingolipid hydroxylase (fatty acid hydroxylase superfamily)